MESAQRNEGIEQRGNGIRNDAIELEGEDGDDEEGVNVRVDARNVRVQGLDRLGGRDGRQRRRGRHHDGGSLGGRGGWVLDAREDCLRLLRHVDLAAGHHWGGEKLWDARGVRWLSPVLPGAFSVGSADHAGGRC